MGTYVRYGSGGGVDLYWTRYEPTVGTKWPAIIFLHPGGYKTGGNDNPTVTQKFADAGFLTLATEYRLAPPATKMKFSGGHPHNGQDDVNLPNGDSGHYPKQTTDVQLAIRTARADPKCDGRVYCVGGSAGGSHSLYMAATGADGDDKPDLVVACSPGVSNLGDLNLLALPAPAPGSETNPYDAIDNYIGTNHYVYPGAGNIPTPPSAPDLAQFVTASPVTYFTANLPPIWGLMASRDSLGIPTSLGVAGQSDVGPPETLVSGGFKQKALDAGMAESTAAVPELGKFKITVVPTADHRHAFEYMGLPIDGITGHQTVQDAIINWLRAGPPKPVAEVFKGTIIGIPSGQSINPSVLSDPNVDGVGLNLSWDAFEHSDGTYDFTGYLIPSIKAIAAAGKKAQITISTQAGSATFGGNTPKWVFTNIGNTENGNTRDILSAATTNLSKVISSPKANWSDADVHRAINGSNIPVPAYIGTVIDANTAWLSSSPTSQVDLSATGTTTVGIFHVPDRPRVDPDTHDAVFGASYTYNDQNANHGGPPLTTIPVFYEPTFLALKKRMINALGNELTNGTLLTPNEKAAVAIVRVAYANSQSEDWSVPNGIDKIDHTTDLTKEWLQPTTGLVYANRGHAYTTQKMIDAAAGVVAAAAFADGQTFTDNRLRSNTAKFLIADEGHGITGTNIAPGTNILKWVSEFEVQLSQNTTGTGGPGLPFTIAQRYVGIIDAAVAACPGQLVEHAIGGNGADLDKAAAQAANDSDVSNFLPRSVATILRTRYPGRVVTTKNSLSAVSPVAPATGNGDAVTSWRLLYQIGQLGDLVAAQDVWNCSDTVTWRMNGGDNKDKENPGQTLTPEQISERAMTHGMTYGIIYREMYLTDELNIPAATKFAHDLLTGGIVILPPPDELPPLPPFKPIIRTVNFTNDTIFGIAAVLQIDTLFDLPPAKVKNMVKRLNQHVRYAWRFNPWPEFTITEERAFRRIWNARDQFTANDEVLYLPDGQYYLCIKDPPPGQTPPSDTSYFIPTTLTDFYIALDQPCRMAIGDVLGVYGADPRTNAIIPGYNFRPSSRGIDVGGPGGSTAWVKFRIRPSVFTNEIWSPNLAYKAGTPVVYAADGQCYRAIIDSGGGFPPTDLTHWMLVPMPEVINDYVVNRTAADLAPDTATAAMCRLDAQTALEAEMDKLFESGQIETYNYAGRGGPPMMEGVSGFWWSISPPYTQGGAISSLTDVCLDQWGNVEVEV